MSSACLLDSSRVARVKDASMPENGKVFQKQKVEKYIKMLNLSYIYQCIFVTFEFLV